MGKIGIRVLPPLVHGKLTGLLELTVDKVEITDKYFKNENFSFVVKILWWGETKPLYIRPKKIQFMTHDNKKIIKTEDSTETAKYEVRTKLKLFKSYLSKCDVMEMAILDAAKSEVIGSVFVKDLIVLVCDTHYFNSSIVDHSGIAIGEMTCHFIYSQIDITKGTGKERTKSQIVGFCVNRDELKLNLRSLQNSRENITQVLTKADKQGSHNNNNLTGFVLPCGDQRQALTSHNPKEHQTLHYNSPVTGNSDVRFNLDEKESAKTITTATERKGREKCMHLNMGQLATLIKHSVDGDESVHIEVSSLPVSRIDSKSKKSNAILKTTKKLNVTTAECSGEIDRNKGAKYSSEVKKASTSKTRFLIQPKMKATVGKNGKIAKSIGNSLVGEKTLAKVSKGSVSNSGVGKLKTFVRVSKEISKLNQTYLDPSREMYDLSNGDIKPAKLENEASEQAFEYDDGDDVDDKNLVIGNASTETCRVLQDTDNSKSGCESRNDDGRKKVSINDKLFFDLDNPIEKLYYETFFLRSKRMDANELKIVELLNQPENKYGLMACGKAGRRERKLRSHVKIGLLSDNVGTEAEKDVIAIEGSKEMSTGNADSSKLAPCRTSKSDAFECKTSGWNCYRCKYFKKLTELDAIIEALKRFELALRRETSNRNDESFEAKEGSDDLSESISMASEGGNIDFSDFSKEDSDFVEFTDYLSKR